MKKGTLANVRPSLPFYGLIKSQHLCKGMAMAAIPKKVLALGPNKEKHSSTKAIHVRIMWWNCLQVFTKWLTFLTFYFKRHFFYKVRCYVFCCVLYSCSFVWEAFIVNTWGPGATISIRHNFKSKNLTKHEKEYSEYDTLNYISWSPHSRHNLRKHIENYFLADPTQCFLSCKCTSIR